MSRNEECWECHKPAVKNLDGVPYCNDCYDYARLKRKALEEQKRAVRIDTMFEKSVSALFRAGFPIEKHKKEAKWVYEAARKNTNMLASMPEMITAIVLTSHHIPVKCQVKIKDYTVDFCLPTYKVILEIDGEQHQWDKDRDRDDYIKHVLTKEWVIVRFKTSFVVKSPYFLVNELRNRVIKQRGYFEIIQEPKGESNDKGRTEKLSDVEA